MAKARAILKRRKAVRNIKKITKTMQMIATAKFQKSLKRATGTKPYTRKVRELVRELAESVGNVEHPLLRRPTDDSTPPAVGKSALVVITSNRGLAGAYNPNVLKVAQQFLKDEDAAGRAVELHVNGKKGVSFFRFQKREMAGRLDVSDQPGFHEVERLAQGFIDDFVAGRIDALHVAYMNFISTGNQKAEVLTLLPLAGVAEATDRQALEEAETESQGAAGAFSTSPRAAAKADEHVSSGTEYDFSPDAASLLDELLPLTVKSAFFQTFLDATTSEHVARMVSMKSATDNADKMGKALQLQYNRARQSQITTELSEIMGGVEAMK